MKKIKIGALLLASFLILSGFNAVLAHSGSINFVTVSPTILYAGGSTTVTGQFWVSHFHFWGPQSQYYEIWLDNTTLLLSQNLPNHPADGSTITYNTSDSVTIPPGTPPGTHTIDFKVNSGFWMSSSVPIEIIKRKVVDTNKPMMGRATNTIKDAKDLLSKAEGLCEGLKEKEDPKFDECCSENKFNEAKELLEMAEKFFMGGNYTAANNYALQAITKLEEIIECIEG